MVVISMVVVTVLISVIVAVIIPSLYSQGEEIYRLGRDASMVLIPKWISTVKDNVLDYGLMTGEEFDSSLRDISIYENALDQVSTTVASLWNSTPEFLGHIANLALVPVFTFFMLEDLPAIKVGLSRLCPKDLKNMMGTSMKNVDSTLRSVMKGQLKVAAILGVLYMIGFTALGLKAAIVIGLIAGICRIVPYMDILVGGVLSILVILTNFQGPGQFLGVIVVIGLVQALDGMIITPRVIGEKVGLHPGVVIGSVLAFGGWLGLAGVLLAIPVMALLKLSITAVLPFYYASSLYDPSK
jgi:predicted PurR-regulated permease PerM